MNIVVLNDTRGDLHFGCDLVMDTISKNLRARGVQTSFISNTLNKDDTIEFIQKESPDLVLVNGEGTFHHSQPRAIELVSVLTYLLESMIPYAIINATIQDNNDHIMRVIKNACFLSVREQRSQQYLLKLGIEGMLCPDLSFGSMTDVKAVNPGRNQTVLYSDSVVTEVGEALMEESNKGTGFISLHHYPFDKYKFLSYRIFCQVRGFAEKLKYTLGFPNRKRFVADLCASREELFSKILASGGVVTGRFHLVCICIGLKIPFLAVESNTYKISGMLADLGLDRLIRFEKGCSFKTVSQFTSAEKIRIDEYLASYKVKEKIIFDRVVEAARRVSI